MQKITLRAVTEDDAEFIFQMMQNKPWQKYYQERLIPKDLEGMRRKLRSAIANSKKNTEHYFVIEENKEPCGIIDIYTINWNDKKAALGYGVVENAWKKGIASKAVKLALIKMKQMGLHACEAVVDPKNKPSKSVLEKNKFKRIGILKDYCFDRGKYADREIYWKVIN